MQWLSDFWASYESTVAFAVVNAFFGLSTFAVLSTGVLSFATVAYAAFGGFIGAQLVLQTGMDPLLALPGAGLAGAALAYGIGLLFLRLEGHWMALASLALVLITRVVVLNAPGLTGGVNGLSLPVDISLGLLALLLLVAIVIFWRLSNSWYGIAARAVREDPAVAATLGMVPRRIQLVAFVISGAVGGIGGMLLALLLQFIGPDTYFINIAFTMIAAVVLGGSYHWAGAVVGALVFTALPVVMQALVPQIQDVANGAALLAIMIFLPRGLIDPRQIRLRRGRTGAGARHAA